MTVALAVICVLTLAAFVMRERDRDRVISRLIDQHNLERSQATVKADRERQLLLNRIKPETAQYIPDDAPLYAPKAVNPAVDDSYWLAQQDMLSKEELAELEDRLVER